MRPYLNMDMAPEAVQPILSARRRALCMGACTALRGGSTCGTGLQSLRFPASKIGKTGSAQIMALEHHEEFESEAAIPMILRPRMVCRRGAGPRAAHCHLCTGLDGHHGGTAAAPLARDVIECLWAGNSAEPVTLAQGGGQ